MKTSQIRVIVSALAACFALMGSGIAHATQSKEIKDEDKSFNEQCDDKNKNAGGEDGYKGKDEREYEGGDRCAPVPEPETYALMLAGLGVVGFVARRRKAD